MTKSEIIKELHNRTKEDVAKCTQMIDTIQDIIWDALIDNGKVKWNELFTMEVVRQPERRGRNPQTGEVETFPEKTKLACKLSKKLKTEITEIWG